MLLTVTRFADDLSVSVVDPPYRIKFFLPRSLYVEGADDVVRSDCRCRTTRVVLTSS